MKARSVKGVKLEEGEPSQSAKAVDRKLLQRMFPASYGDKLLQVNTIPLEYSAIAYKRQKVLCSSKAKKYSRKESNACSKQISGEGVTTVCVFS